MRKSEIFNEIVDKVCDICEVDRDLLMRGSKLQSVVDARILAIQYLKRSGLSDDDIALTVFRSLAGDPSYTPPLDVLKKKSKAINKAFNTYSQRCLSSYAFCLMSEDIRDFCRKRYENLYLAGMKELPSR